MRPALLILAAALLGGCVQLTDLDPVGNAASISGRWTIDGHPPGTAGCARLGASRIRVTFLDDLRPVSHPGLFFQCNPSGGNDELGFDTRDGNGAVVAQGCWTIRLTALDAVDARVAVGPSMPFLVPGEDVDPAGCSGTAVTDHIDLGTTDFLSASVIAATALAGARAGEVSCTDAGIEEVRIVFDDLGGGRVDALGEAGVSMVSKPCSLGLLAARVLPGHTYVAHLETVDGSGGVTQGPTQSFEVGMSGGDRCYFGAGCRAFCGGGGDCSSGASCTSDQCVPDGESVDPRVDLGSL